MRVWLPTAKLDVLKLAVLTPPLLLKVPWPMLVVPSEKVTVPLGLATALLPGLLMLTVAVKVTLCPNTGEPAEETTVVLVPAFATVWFSVPVLPA